MNKDLQRLLNEIDNLKTRLQQIRPIPQEALNKIKARFEMEYTYESNRIEGNTLTLQETALVVSEGVTISGKSMREHLEAINHAQAVTYIRDKAGKYRTVPVMIAGSRHTPPQPYMIIPLMEQFIRDCQSMETDRQHPVLIAAFLHDELIKIHPFIDGNGRTSRLLMNLYLLSKNYTITTLKGDNEAKQAYYTALEQSHTAGDRAPFYLLVAQAVKKSLEQYIGIIEG
jgi:Fic family protein